MTPSYIRRPRQTPPACRTAISAEGWRPRRIWSFGSVEEPSLSELMNDPIFGHLLASDGLEHDHVKTLMSEMRYKLGYA
jgi:hypothetical protein